ncbi:major cardiolipin synthase ClsA [Peptococcaceae bacterium CEB3]|nr:major cardiolipin synthase ClsA [Peptococcaceae bacterium CEB3]
MLWVGGGVAVLLAIMEVGIVLFRENRDPARTMAWILILALLPGVGFFIYVLFSAQRARFRDKHFNLATLEEIAGAAGARPEREEQLSEEEGKKLARLLLNSALAPLTEANSVKVYQTGQEKFKHLLEALAGAKHHIHLEYYIFRDDVIGGQIKNLLLQKCSQGVEVRFLVDGMGSHALSRAFFAELKAGGVKTGVFAPLRLPGLLRNLNFRNHRKIVVIDGRVGFIGGFNVGDEYLSARPEVGFWRDTHLELRGRSVHFLQAAFLNDWHFATRERLTAEPYFPRVDQAKQARVQIIASGPDQDWRPSLQLFFTLLTGAREKIYIETPYFIPDAGTMMALEAAALSGIDVRLMTQGVPDHKITFWASRSYFADLLRAGVKIYAYKKGILHSKAVLVDGKYGMVGSTNFDIRSFELDFEINALIYERKVVARLEDGFARDVQDAEAINPEVFEQRRLGERLREAAAKLLAPVL